MKILDHIADTSAARCEALYSHEDIYLRRDLVRLHQYAGCFVVLDLTHAMKPGQRCELFKLDYPRDHHPVWLSELLDRHRSDFRKVLAELLALPWAHNPKWPASYLNLEMTDTTREAHRFTVMRESRQATRVFSPFATVAPLKTLPAKWTIPHVVRCLLNGQFERLECDGIYTDDYAHDAAVNFHKGDFSAHAQAFAKRIYESPSGWRAYEHSGRVSICCHHFDNNSFTPKIDAMKISALKTAAAPTVTPAPTRKSKSKTRSRAADSTLAAKVRAISALVLHTPICARTVLTPEELHTRFIEFCQPRTDADWRTAWTAFLDTLALTPLEPQPEPQPERGCVADQPQQGDASNVITITFSEPAPAASVPVQPATRNSPATIADRWAARLRARHIL